MGNSVNLGLMKCLWLEEKKLALRHDAPEPRCESDEALIQVRLAGICSTDLELSRGYYPYAGVPGHEFVGLVAEAKTSPELVGTRVVGEINLPCRTCQTCLSGRPTHCPERKVLGIVGKNGALAEYLTLPIANLHTVPDSVSDEAAVFCEPLAAAIEILEQVHIRPTDRVMVLGAGRLGQLISQVLASVRCDLLVVERQESNRKPLKNQGIRTSESLPEKLFRSFDVVVESSGSPQGFAITRNAVRPRGTLVLKSTYAGNLEIDASSLVVDEITVVGSRCGPFAPALRMLEQGVVDPTPFIEAQYSLDDGLKAFEHAARPGALKILLKGSA